MREIDTGVQEAFIKEVNEDLKNESMKKMWDKYGLYIIILVVAALTAAVSFEAIKAWYTKKLQTWSDSYAYALSLQNQGKYDESTISPAKTTAYSPTLPKCRRQTFCLSRRKTTKLSN